MTIESRSGSITVRGEVFRPWLIGSARLESGLDAALNLLQQLGVRVPDSGRHVTALRHLHTLNSAMARNGFTPNRTKNSQLQHSQRTAWETTLIAVAAFRAHHQRRGRSFSSVPFPVDRLQAMMGGPTNYANSPSASWDAQFELFIAAQLVLGGLEVRSGEPDIRFKFGYEWVGIACKRLTSLALPQMRRNISKASEQIVRTGRRGIIALNLESLLHDIAVTGRKESVIRRFNSAFDRIDPALTHIADRTDILAMLSQVNLSEWKFRSRLAPQLNIRLAMRWTYTGIGDPGAILHFQEFREGLSARMRQALVEISSGDITQVI